MPPHRLAWTAGDRILWTGGDQPRTPDRLRQQTLVQRTGTIDVRALARAAGHLRDPAGARLGCRRTRWAVTACRSSGPHRNYPRHLFALGLGSNPAAAFLASRLLLRHVTATLDKTDEAFGFSRPSRADPSVTADGGWRPEQLCACVLPGGSVVDRGAILLPAPCRTVPADGNPSSVPAADPRCHSEIPNAEFPECSSKNGLHASLNLRPGVRCRARVAGSPRRGTADARGELGLALMLRKLATVGTVMHAPHIPTMRTTRADGEAERGTGAPRRARDRDARQRRAETRSAPSCSRRWGSSGRRIAGGAPVRRRRTVLHARVDFGFSFSVEESVEKWGHDEIARRLRTAHSHDTAGPHRHDASRRRRGWPAPSGVGANRDRGVSARPAIRRSTPQQLQQGIPPVAAAEGVPGPLVSGCSNATPRLPRRTSSPWTATATSTRCSDALGRSGSEARAMHKCQGFGQLLALPGPFVVKYKLVDTTLASQRERQESTLEDGLDLTLTRTGRFAGAQPDALAAKLAAIADAVRAAEGSLRARGPDAAVPDSRAGCQPRGTSRVAGCAHAAPDSIDRLRIDFRFAERAQIRDGARHRTGSARRGARGRRIVVAGRSEAGP